jgi:hypothetical protein
MFPSVSERAGRRRIAPQGTEATGPSSLDPHLIRQLGSGFWGPLRRVFYNINRQFLPSSSARERNRPLRAPFFTGLSDLCIRAPDHLRSERGSSATSPATLSGWARADMTLPPRTPRRGLRWGRRRASTWNWGRSVLNSRWSTTFSPSAPGCFSRNRTSGQRLVDLSRQRRVRASRLRVGQKWRLLPLRGGGRAGAGWWCWQRLSSR